MPGSPGGGPRPQAIGVRKSLGYGDRLGLAAAGQVAAAMAHPDFIPFFAQHSAWEMAEVGRTSLETLAVATRAVGNARFRRPWGADADLLRTPQAVDETSAAGYTYFTIDLSEHVRDDVAELSPGVLAATVEAMIAAGELPDDWASPYLDRVVDLPGAEGMRLDLDTLRQAAVKFGRAVQHGARMYETVARANRGRPYEIEISLDQTATPISAAEHLFIGLELESRGVRPTGMALRLDDSDHAAFETGLRLQVAVASFCGPYKLSFRSGTHDPAVVPAIGRCCGDLLHYKTSAESLLEALRLAWRLEPPLFQQIMAAVGVSVDADSADAEAIYLDAHGTGSTPDFAAGWERHDAALKAKLLALLEQRDDMYQELLLARYQRLMQSLNAG